MSQTREAFDPDSAYLGMKLNRNRDGRVVLAFGDVLAKAGDKVRYLDKNGHDYQRELARKVFGVDAILTVERISVGRSSSKYFFKDVPGEWNTVMFERLSPDGQAVSEEQT